MTQIAVGMLIGLLLLIVKLVLVKLRVLHSWRYGPGPYKRVCRACRMRQELRYNMVSRSMRWEVCEYSLDSCWVSGRYTDS